MLTALKKLFVALLTIAFILIFGVISQTLVSKGMENNLEIRQFERVPQLHINQLLEGEAKIVGRAYPVDSSKLIRYDRDNSRVIYHRRLIERKVKSGDSTSWVTQSDTTRTTSFFLEDDTGKILVLDQTLPEKNWSIKEKKSFREGDLRTTDWVIHPETPLFAFGWADLSSKLHVIRFDTQGSYQPVLSSFGESYERSRGHYTALMWVWAGLAFSTLAIYLLLKLFKIHRLWIYLFTLTTIMILQLGAMGILVTYTDIQDGLNRLNRQEENARALIEQLASRYGIQWDDWENERFFSYDVNQYMAEEDQKTVARTLDNLALAYTLHQNQLQRFPENLIQVLVPARSTVEHHQNLFASTLNSDTTSFEKADTRLRGKWKYLQLVGVLLLSFGVTFWGFFQIKIKRMIENLPTTKISGLTMGLNELKGKCVGLLPDYPPLEGPLSTMPCIYYHYTVKERRGSGKNARWVKIEDECHSTPFLLQDRTGSVTVAPEGAKIYTQHHLSRRSGKLLYQEKSVHINDTLYVLGTAHINQQTFDTLEIGADSETGAPFLVSNFDQNTLMQKIGSHGLLIFNFGFIAFLNFCLLFLGLFGGFNALDFFLAALSAPLYMGILTAILHYNDLIFLRLRATRNLSNIDVALQKRADLIPNLNTLARHYSQYEQHIQQIITQLRSPASSANAAGTAMPSSQRNLKPVSPELKLLGENHPELKADTVFSTLMNAITQLENELALMRESYNDAVNSYHTRLDSFPDLIFKRLFRIHKLSYVH
jgi:hypothetical protein